MKLKILIYILLFSLSLLHSQDSLSTIKDSLKTNFKVDTLQTLRINNPLSYFNSSIIPKEFFLLTPYRTTANLLEYTPFSFNTFSDISGQPYNNFIYNNKSDITLDGIQLFNRFNTPYDLNYLQTEIIDTIFIAKSYNAFYFNNHSINFSSYDNYYNSPYTRIKYTQGPNQDSYIDGIFNVLFSKKVGLHFQITHSHIDSTFSNDLSSFWQGNIKFRYNLSNNLQFELNYRHNTSQVNMNGGLVDSIKYTKYDELSSIPFFRNMYNKNFSNLFSLTSWLKLSEANIIRLKLYSNNLQDNFRLNENATSNFILNDYSEKRNGLNITFPLNYKYVSGLLLMNLERFSLNNFLNSNNFDISYTQFSIAPQINFKYDFINLAFYTRYLNRSNNGFIGFGGETKISTSSFQIGLGASYSENPIDIYNLHKSEYQFIKNSEVNSEASFKYFFDKSSTKISIFIKNSNDYPIFYANSNDYNERFRFIGFDLENVNYFGINSLTHLNFKNFEINNNLFFYHNNSKQKFIPNFALNFSVYYKNILFNESLDLKAGLKFELWDKVPYYTTDLITNQNIQYYKDNNSLLAISEYKGELLYKIDFVSASRIKNNAILYLTLENLLGAKYHKIPFHPGRGRSFLFSIRWEFFD